MRAASGKIISVMVIGMVLYGCGGKPPERVRIKKIIKKDKKQKIAKSLKGGEAAKYKYEGLKYGSPFSPSGRVTSAKKITAEQEGTKVIESPESLKVTGLFTDKEGKYAILSGVGEFYIVKQGRLYNEDEHEMPGIAAIIKESKIILITDEDKMYELPVPE